MNNLVCHVCQQQFKAASGLSWHLDRIHDQSVEDVHTEPSSLEEDCSEADSLAIKMDSLPGELMEQIDRIGESLTRFSHDIEEVKRRVFEWDKTALTIQALSTESFRQSERDVEIDELLHAVSTLLWELDRPNRKPQILASFAAGGAVNPPHLPYAREKVAAFLRHSDTPA